MAASGKTLANGKPSCCIREAWMRRKRRGSAWSAGYKDMGPSLALFATRTQGRSHDGKSYAKEGSRTRLLAPPGAFWCPPRHFFAARKRVGVRGARLRAP